MTSSTEIKDIQEVRNEINKALLGAFIGMVLAALLVRFVLTPIMYPESEPVKSELITTETSSFTTDRTLTIEDISTTLTNKTIQAEVVER